MTSGISYFLSNNSIMTDESSGFYLWRWPLVITIIFWLLQISSWIREFLERFWNSFIETTDCFLAARIFKTISSHKSLKYKHVSNIWQYVRNGEYILWSQSIRTQHFQQRKVYGSITIHITCSPSLVFWFPNITLHVCLTEWDFQNNKFQKFTPIVMLMWDAMTKMFRTC